MKYIKYLLFLFLLNIPFNVLAYGVQLSCPTSVKTGSTFTCTIYSPSLCSEITMDLELPDGFKLKNEKPGKNFKSNSNGNSLAYTTSGNIERVLSALTITAPKSFAETKATISLKNLKYKYTKDDNEYTVTSSLSENIIITGKVGTTTTTTSSVPTTVKPIEAFILTLKTENDDEEQTLSCNPTNGSCEIILTNATIPTKDGYTFNGWGDKEGCAEGETKKYILKSNKTLYACFKDNINRLARLESLEVVGYQINFTSDNLNYLINVSKKTNISDIVINTKAYNDKAVVEVNKPNKLVPGENIIEIKVTEDKTVETYILKINKEESKVPVLSKLTIKNHNINFNSNVFNYDLKINSDESKLDINPVFDNEDVNIEITGNENLSNGSIIIIKLTNSEGMSTTYNINISINSLFEQYRVYIISAIIVIFMFTVYFIVRNIKTKKGEIPVKPKKPKKKKKQEVKKEKVKKEKKSNKKKKNQGKDDETLKDSSEPIETLEVL